MKMKMKKSKQNFNAEIQDQFTDRKMCGIVYNI